MRPPLRRYSRVSSATYRSTSARRASSVRAISAPLMPASARSAASKRQQADAHRGGPGIDDVDLPLAAAFPAPTRAAATVPDRCSETWTDTTDSAPAANAASYASWNAPGRRGRGRGERRVGRRHPRPERLGGEIDAGAERLVAERHRQRDDPDAPRRRHLGQQIRRRIGDHRHSSHEDASLPCRGLRGDGLLLVPVLGKHDHPIAIGEADRCGLARVEPRRRRPSPRPAPRRAAGSRSRPRRAAAPPRRRCRIDLAAEADVVARRLAGRSRSPRGRTGRRRPRSSSLFSEICDSIRLTSCSLTMKSSARVTSARARLRTSSISLTIEKLAPSLAAMSRRCSSVTSVRASARCASRRVGVAEDDHVVVAARRRARRAVRGRSCRLRRGDASCSRRPSPTLDRLARGRRRSATTWSVEPGGDVVRRAR